MSQKTLTYTHTCPYTGKKTMKTITWTWNGKNEWVKKETEE